MTYPMAAHVGVDISNSSIKVTEAEVSEKGFMLKSFGEVSHSISLQTTSAQEEAAIAKTLRDLIVKTKVHSRDAYVAVPEAYVYSRVIQLPVLKEHEVKNAIRFEAEQYIPVPLGEVYLEYQVLTTPAVSSGEKMDVLLVAAKRHVVDKLMHIVELAELTPLVMETSLLAAIRAVKPQLGSHTMFVDIGEGSTDIAVFQNHILKQFSSLATGGDALTRAIAQNLSLSKNQAEKYKQTYGLDKDQLEGRVHQAMKIPIQDIFNHITKNMQFIHNLGAGSVINQLTLSGGGALLPGLSHVLVQELNIEVNLANPLSLCLNAKIPKQLVSAAPRFSSVIGLAIRD